MCHVCIVQCDAFTDETCRRVLSSWMCHASLSMFYVHESEIGVRLSCVQETILNACMCHM